MEFKVNTSGLTCIVADAPEQRREFESRALRTDDQGRPLFTVRLLVMDGERSAPIKVGLIGDPGMDQGTFVRPVGLALNTVDRRGETVTWWTAEGLEPAVMPGAQSAGQGTGQRGAQRRTDGSAGSAPTGGDNSGKAGH